MTNLYELSIGQTLSGFSSGQFSPSDIVAACIARYELLEDRCLAWEIFDADALKQQALITERRLADGEVLRALEGIPLGIKDIFNTVDFPTQMGSPLWKGFTPGNDARIVFNARQLGALIPGKTTTAEFAVHALSKTLNPYSPFHTPGTSSSGSAVAVASGMVPVSLGTQTAGSITRPASFCGVYGMKPSFGLLPRTGMLKTADTLDTIGFFTAHQADLRHVFDGLRVRGGNYPIVQAKVDTYSPKPEGTPWRVAFIKTHTWDGAADYVQQDIRDWVSKLGREKHIEVLEVDEPALLKNAHSLHSVAYDKALAYYFKEEFKRRELVSPIMNETVARGNKVSQDEYLEALDAQAQMANAMDILLASFDAFISIGTASAAPLREQVEDPDPSLIWTLTYLPTITVPLFKSPEGLPFGLQIGARRYNDYRLLDFTDELTERGLMPQRCAIAD
ncbi:amidase [Alphaproteobacteria bacterium]|nr:amidase [Alphaproteobacteria bacterium]